MGWGFGIRDPGSGKKPIPDPGSGSKVNTAVYSVFPTLALVRSTTRLPPFFSPDFSVFSGDSEKIIKRISHFAIKLPVQLPRKYYKQSILPGL
jgi:hypothetical protein